MLRLARKNSFRSTKWRAPIRTSGDLAHTSSCKAAEVLCLPQQLVGPVAQLVRSQFSLNARRLLHLIMAIWPLKLKCTEHANLCDTYAESMI